MKQKRGIFHAPLFDLSLISAQAILKPVLNYVRRQTDVSISQQHAATLNVYTSPNRAGFGISNHFANSSPICVSQVLIVDGESFTTLAMCSYEYPDNRLTNNMRSFRLGRLRNLSISTLNRLLLDIFN